MILFKVNTFTQTCPPPSESTVMFPFLGNISPVVLDVFLDCVRFQELKKENKQTKTLSHFTEKYYEDLWAVGFGRDLRAYEPSRTKPGTELPHKNAKYPIQFELPHKLPIQTSF